MVNKEVLTRIINPRMKRVLQFAQAALPGEQFQAFRKLVLDEFGNSGLGKDLDTVLAEERPREGYGTGRKIHAGKEVPS